MSAQTNPLAHALDDQAPDDQDDLFGSLYGHAGPGPEFDYDEILRKARAAIDQDYEAPAKNSVGQMHSGIAEAFSGPAPEATPELQTAPTLQAQPEVDVQPQVQAEPRPQPAQAQAQAEAQPVFEIAPPGVAPRISIHLFCELASTASIGEQALKDRRLARASGAIFPGGLPAAIARYRSHTTPSLIIVEAGEDTGLLLANLDRLAEVCDVGAKVLVIGRKNDIGLYRELVRRGVSEYLISPEPLDLIGAVSGLYDDPAAPFVGRTVAVRGAKGGVGASIIAHNLAHALSERLESNTVLVDLDLPFGAAGLNFNQDPLQGVAHALADPERLDPVLLDRMMVRCSDRLSLFAAPAHLDEDHEHSASAYAEVTQKVKGAAPFVVLDLPHLWSGWMRQTLLAADEAVVVATPELASLRNAKNLIELLTQGRPNDGPPRLILNMVGVPGRPEISVKDFAEAVGLQPALILPFEPKLFGQAANNGQMLFEANAKCKAAEAIGGLARTIARRDTAAFAAAPASKASSVLGALFKLKS
ncbi:MAG TPA: cellulose synthase operon protein YhjQ/BcsQ [Caulobacteraceae bacterium]|jgi:pilus assembly protein CpaE